MRNAKKLQLLFLGERRISWEVLKILTADEFAPHFDIPVIVSNDQIHRKYIDTSPVKHVRFISNSTRKSAEILAAIHEERIDLLFSVQYNWVLPGEVLDGVSGQAFNLHNAKLPDYKGYNSVTHAILNGDKNYESTIHWMKNEVDSGDIAYVESTEIHSRDTALSLYLRTIDSAVRAAWRLLSDLRDGKDIPRKPMASTGGVFYGKKSVHAIADTTNLRDPDEIARIARATFFPPFNMAYRVIAGQKFFVAPEEDHQNAFIAKQIPNEPNYDCSVGTDDESF